MIRKQARGTLFQVSQYPRKKGMTRSFIVEEEYIIALNRIIDLYEKLEKSDDSVKITHYK